HASTLRSMYGSVSADARRRYRAKGRCAYRAGEKPSAVDLATGHGIGVDIEGWRDQVHPLRYSNRSAMRAEQNASSGVLLQQATHCQRNSFGLIAPRQALGCLLDQSDNLWT